MLAEVISQRNYYHFLYVTTLVPLILRGEDFAERFLGVRTDRVNSIA